jgi:hypothetical protein
MAPLLVGLRRGVERVRREVRSIHSNATTPPSWGCGRWPFVSVRGSRPQITDQKAAAADNDDNRYKEGFHAAPLSAAGVVDRPTVSSGAHPNNIYLSSKHAIYF